MFAAALLAFMVSTTVVRGDTTPAGSMLRYPDVSQTEIVFSYAGDLWLVSREGGVARPLTSPTGSEVFPRFNADGTKLAFMGNYDGGRDLYTISVTGGVPRRMTYHPAMELLCDWTPQGSLLYATNAFTGLGRVLQLVEISGKDPLPRKLPLAYGTNGALSEDGTWLAFTPYSRDTRSWKRYRGGMASDVWLFHMKNKTAKRITDWEGTDTIPMWHGQTVYYLSDAGAEHKLNIWSYDTATGARKQITKLDEYDIKWPAMGPGPKGQGEIVFQHGSHLHLLDLPTSETRAINVTIPGDRPAIMDHRVDVAKLIAGADISPTGKRVVVEARGDLWSLPAKNGTPRNMTRSSGVAERSPSWSPDGRWIAYLADLTGEYELYIKQSDGKGETRRLTDNGTVFRYSPSWSPDSKQIVFTDKTGTIWLYTLADKSLVKVDRDPWATQLNIGWSHDSSWLAYAKRADDHVGASSIWLYDISNRKVRRLTDDMFNDSAPTFDRKGEFLYFASSRYFGSPIYEDVGSTFVYGNTEVLIAVPLRSDVKYPFLAKSDEEPFSAKEPEKRKEESGAEKKDAKKPGKETAPEKKADSSDESGAKEKDAGKQPAASETKEEAKPDGKKAEAEASASKPEAKKTMKIEFDGIMRRAFQLPVTHGIFSGLVVNDRGQLIYARRGARGTSTKPAIKVFDLADASRQEKTVLDGASTFGISADGKKLIVLMGRSLAILGAAAGQKPATVSTSGMRTTVTPREEWKQIFQDAWRIERDFFYDPNMHHVDWPAVRTRYEKMLADCASRRDVGFVISEMIAEINVGHAYYRPGVDEQESSRSAGLLGCEFTRRQGAYQIARLYEGAVWDVDARNPLRQAGIKQGEYLLAVNHLPVDMHRSPYAALDGLAGKTVILTVGPKPKPGDECRDVAIKTLTSDSNLRYRGWIEKNRRYVERKTKGQVGYIYVPDTGTNGQDNLFRQFYGQMAKRALIIDERWNGGGQIPTRFIELLNRPVTNYWARRDGHDMTWPPDAHLGPKCMLINGLAGSGGDMFPALFRQAKLGKLIGRRTWGGLVGISGNPGMIDGSSVTAPTFAFYEKDGTWGIEGHGVDPDIDVIDDPGLLSRGVDPQLDAAVELMQKEVKQHPYTPAKRPAYPNRKGMGVRPEDK